MNLNLEVNEKILIFFSGKSQRNMAIALSPRSMVSGKLSVFRPPEASDPNGFNHLVHIYLLRNSANCGIKSTK